MALCRAHVAHLSAAEERTLATRIQAGGDRRAVARIVESHLGLVTRLANELHRDDVAFDDLLQEGRLGLVVAAHRFDPDRGARFSTYATFWVRAYMMEHIMRSHGPVRIGRTRAERRVFFGLGRARRRLELCGQEATSEALANALEVEPGELDDILTRLNRSDVGVDGEQLAGDDDPERCLAGHQTLRERRQLLADALQALPPRERAIMTARHFVAHPATLARIGQRMRLSRERVRQLEQRALQRLRSLCVQAK